MKVAELYPLEHECILTEDNLWEMARVRQSDSGLPYVFFVSPKQYSLGAHGPRLKVSNVPNTFSKTDNFVVSISKKLEVMAGKPAYSMSAIEDIKDWIILNYVPLIKFWNDEYDSDADFYAELQKL